MAPTYEELLEAYVKQEQTVTKLQQEIENLKSLITNQKNIKDSKSESEFCTDEEELQNEFIPVKKTVKRKRVPTESPKEIKDNNKNQKKKEVKIPLPPPINVYNVANFGSFRKLLLDELKEEVTFNVTSNNVIKISTKNEEEYRKVKNFIKNTNDNSKANNESLPQLEYYTYQLKSERLYRFVVRGLPSSLEVKDIEEEIRELGHDVTNVLNIQRKKNINGDIKIYKFPLFYVDIRQKENNKSVFDIKELLNCKVRIEPPKKTNAIPQCTNCQQLGHTKSFCCKQAKCVKCAGDHHTRICTKTSNSAATCALCNEKGHPASYKGCPIYQKKLKTQQTKVSVVQRLKEKRDMPKMLITPSTSGLSYAQITKMSTDKQNTVTKAASSCTEPTIADVMKMLSSFQADIKNSISQLSTRVDRLESKSPPTKKQKTNTK